jgi:hypothetical protein
LIAVDDAEKTWTRATTGTQAQAPTEPAIDELKKLKVKLSATNWTSTVVETDVHLLVARIKFGSRHSAPGMSSECDRPDRTDSSPFRVDAEAVRARATELRRGSSLSERSSV